MGNTNPLRASECGMVQTGPSPGRAERGLPGGEGGAGRRCRAVGSPSSPRTSLAVHPRARTWVSPGLEREEQLSQQRVCVCLGAGTCFPFLTWACVGNFFFIYGTILQTEPVGFGLGPVRGPDVWAARYFSTGRVRSVREFVRDRAELTDLPRSWRAQ